MAMSNREKNLVLILPAMGIIAYYGLFPLRAQLNQSRQATADLAASQARLPSTEELQALQARVATIQQDVLKETQTWVQVESRWRHAGGQADGLVGRPQRIEMFNRILAQSGLSLIDSHDTEGAADSQSFAGLVPMARQLSEISENQQPRQRIVRFRGAYSDVCTSLDELSRGQIVAVPLGLTMKTTKGIDPESSVREWTLLVWV